VSERTLFLGRPNPRQREFFLAKNRFIAYGGARGGGKSWAVRRKAVLMALRYPGIRMLLLRRTYPELRENHILPLRREAGDLAEWRETEKCLCFSGGSRLQFGYLDSDSDLLRYQGQEYDVLFLDEATQFTEGQFAALTACVRGANPFPKRIYLTCNPGGVGHAWVKRLFIDRQFRGAEDPADYRFIPARVYDNKALLKQDKGYVKMLETLPDGLRQAWLLGDWDSFAGQYFTEWDRAKHVVRPFAIPKGWKRFFAMDYGLDMLAGYCGAVDESGHLWIYKEVYRSGLIISQAAAAIRELTAGEGIRAFYAPPDLWNRRQETGRSMAELFAKQGIRLQPADAERIPGWLRLREWLGEFPTPEGGSEPGLRIFETCTELIRCLPQLRCDEDRPGDCADRPHELTHGPDALRYLAGMLPMPALPEQAPPRLSDWDRALLGRSRKRGERIKII